MNSRTKLLCTVGPTATGKTDIALDLAIQLNGELVACDSRQVYTGLDLGTGKEAASEFSISKHSGYWMVGGIKIWMYDMADPSQQYSASDYIDDARRVIETIWHSGKLPIVVGGTGLYLDALIKGIDTRIGPNEKLRQNLKEKSLKEVQDQYAQLSPNEFAALNNSEKNNKRRLIRKIEILEQGEKMPVNDAMWGGFDVLKIGLIAPKEVLDERIEKRVLKRLDQGMLEEAKDLHAGGLTFARMRQLGLEYREMADFLDGKLPDKEAFIVSLQQKIKQFAKRQMTWFKRDSEIHWFDITEAAYQPKLVNTVRNWYNTRKE